MSETEYNDILNCGDSEDILKLYFAIDEDLGGHSNGIVGFYYLHARCQLYCPAALVHLEPIKTHLDAMIAEMQRCKALIYALYKEAGNDGYHGQVEEQLVKLASR